MTILYVPTEELEAVKASLFEAQHQRDALSVAWDKMAENLRIRAAAADAAKETIARLERELCDAREATCIVRMQDYMDLETVPAIRKLYELWQEAAHRPEGCREQVRVLLSALDFVRTEHRDMVSYCEQVIASANQVKT